MAQQNRDEILDAVAGLMASHEQRRFEQGMGSGIIGEFAPEKDNVRLWENLRNKFGNWLRKSYRVSDWDDATAAALKKADAGKLRELYVKKHPANEVKREVEYSAFKNLFEPKTFIDEQGNEKTDPDWTSMDRDQIEQAAKELGYNIRTKADRDSFYGKLMDYATVYGKSKAVSDYLDEHPGRALASAILSPTSYKEQMRQALTDAPMSEKSVYGLSALDGIVNAGMLAGGAALPYRSALVSTALLEGARQGGSAASGNGFEIAPIVGAAVSQATIPAGVMGLSNMFGRKATDQSVRSKFRDFMAGVRGGTADAMENEKNLVIGELLRARKEARATPASSSESDIISGMTNGQVANLGIIRPAVSGEKSRLEAMRRKLRALGYTTREDADDWLTNFGAVQPPRNSYTLKQMMGEPEQGIHGITDEAATKDLVAALHDKDTFTLMPTSTEDVIYPFLSPELQAAARESEKRAVEKEASWNSYFPTHYAFHRGDYVPLDKSSKAYLAGKQLGPALGAGEAATGVSIPQLVQYMTTLDATEIKNKKNKYTETDWYKELGKTRRGRGLLEQLQKNLKKGE